MQLAASRLALTAVTAMLTAGLQAQCSITSSMAQPYGQGCAHTGSPPTLVASVAPGTCLLSASMIATQGTSPNTIVAAAFVIGLQQTTLPLSQFPFRPGCEILATTNLLLIVPTAGVTPTVRFALPPSLPLPLDLFLQGAVLYSVTGVDLSAAVRLTLR